MNFPFVSINTVATARRDDIRNNNGILRRDDGSAYSAFTLCEEFPSGLHLRLDSGEYYVAGREGRALCLLSSKLRDHPGQVTEKVAAHPAMCPTCADVWVRSGGAQKALEAEKSGVRLIPVQAPVSPPKKRSTKKVKSNV